jgi:hypothetical protein
MQKSLLITGAALGFLLLGAIGLILAHAGRNQRNRRESAPDRFHNSAVAR